MFWVSVLRLIPFSLLRIAIMDLVRACERGQALLAKRALARAALQAWWRVRGGRARARSAAGPNVSGEVEAGRFAQRQPFGFLLRVWEAGAEAVGQKMARAMASRSPLPGLRARALALRRPARVGIGF